MHWKNAERKPERNEKLENFLITRICETQKKSSRFSGTLILKKRGETKSLTSDLGKEANQVGVGLASVIKFWSILI